MLFVMQFVGLVVKKIWTAFYIRKLQIQPLIHLSNKLLKKKKKSDEKLFEKCVFCKKRFCPFLAIFWQKPYKYLFECEM